MGGDHEEGGRFRFRRSPIDRIVGDWEFMLRQAEARAEAAERRVEELERALQELRSEAGARPQGRGGGERARGPRPEGGESDRGEDDFRSALASIERGAQEVLDRVSGALGGGEAEELLAELRAQLARLGAWRDRMDPSMRSLRARIEEVMASIEDLPERVRGALGPLAARLQAAEAEIAKFTEAGDFALPAAEDPPSRRGGPEGE